MTLYLLAASEQLEPCTKLIEGNTGGLRPICRHLRPNMKRRTVNMAAIVVNPST